MDERRIGDYRAMLCRFLLFLLGDRDAAEEIAQETFRVALAKGSDPSKGTNYGAWLRSIARNLVRNHVRRMRRSPLLLAGDMLEHAERRFAATESDRDEVWEARRQALEGCLAGLPEPDRALLRRRYGRGEPVQAIAATLGVAPNALSKRLGRLRLRLGRCIEAALEETSSD